MRQRFEAGLHREVVDGAWVSEEEAMGAGKRHGKLGARLIMALGPFVEANDLGEVYQDNTEFVLDGTPGDALLPNFTLDLAWLFK